MAEKEEKKKSTEATTENSPKPNRKKIFLIGGIGLAAVAAIGVGLFFFLNSGKSAKPKESASSAVSAKEGGHGGKEGVKSANPSFFPLEPFILNLADIDSNRYLKISVTIELNDPRAGQEAESRIPQIRDALILLMSSLTYGDIHSIEGKITLQSEIQNRLNKILESGAVKRVYFTDLVVQ